MMGGDAGLVEVLIANGADVNSRDEEGWSVLHTAITLSSLGKARILLAHGANHDVHTAAAVGDESALRALLQEDAQLVHARGIYDRTPLHWAAQLGRTDIVGVLAAAGAKLDSPDFLHSTPLHLAAEKGRKEMVALLLARGADPNAADISGYTPLHLAAWEGHKDVAEALLHGGAQIDAIDNTGRTALRIAARRKHYDVFTLLVDRGAEHDIHTAACQGDVAALQVLLEQDRGLVHDRAEYEWTPLHRAAERGHTEAARVLLAAGADLNATDKIGGTPLRYAADGGHAEVVGLLLASGAQVNVSDGYGETPLHIAARRGYKDIVSLLVANGAQVNLRDRSGTTPLRTAVEFRRTGVAKFLREHGATE